MGNTQEIGTCYSFIIPYSGSETNIRVVTDKLLDEGQVLIVCGNQFLIKQLTYIPIVFGKYKSHYYCTVSWLREIVYGPNTKKLKPREMVEGPVSLLTSQEAVA